MVALLPEIFVRLGLALAIGFLIGVERGWRDRDLAEGDRTAGIRTFSLIGLSGGVAGALQPAIGPAAFAVIGLAAAGTVILYKWRENLADDDHSATTPVAAIVVFGLGSYAVVGDMAAAAAGGVATAGLLAFKEMLHGWLRRLTWIELRAALMLLAMTAVVLPLLPDRTVDPWGAINPYAVWLMAVLIGALSFVGYVAVQVGGPGRGVLFAGLAGGLVSSTAVTLNHGRQAAAAPAATAPLAAGTALAGAVGVLRALAVPLVLAPALAFDLAAVLLPAAAGFGLATLFLYRLSGDGERAGRELDLVNPFDALQAIRFALLLAAVLALSKILAERVGARGYIAFAALSGAADVDAIALSASRLTGAGGLDGASAAGAIVAAVVANTVMKTVYAFAAGGARYGRLVAFASLVAVVAGGLGALAAAAWSG